MGCTSSCSETLTATARSGQRRRHSASWAQAELQHLASDLDHQPGLLGDGEELRRRQQSEGGVLPPDQGLDGAHLTGAGLDDRHEVHAQPAVGNALSQVGLDAQPLARVVQQLP